MYSIVFSGPALAYKAVSYTRSEADARVKRLQDSRLSVIVLMYGTRPLAMWTHIGGGRYRKRAW